MKPSKTWFLRALVATCGGAIAVFAAVFVNRVLIFVHFYVQKHPETGSVAVTMLSRCSLSVPRLRR